MDSNLHEKLNGQNIKEHFLLFFCCFVRDVIVVNSKKFSQLLVKVFRIVKQLSRSIANQYMFVDANSRFF